MCALKIFYKNCHISQLKLTFEQKTFKTIFLNTQTALTKVTSEMLDKFNAFLIWLFPKFDMSITAGCHQETISENIKYTCMYICMYTSYTLDSQH